MTPHYTDPWLTVYHGDARAVMAEMEPESVHCVVTSPPYWGLRDYGSPGQLGLEPTPEAYVDGMVAVFREVRRILRSDGTVWLNLGDSYNAGTTAPSSPSRTADVGGWTTRSGDAAGARRIDAIGLKPKDLVGIPWRVAFALQSDGWYLRSDIIWSKPNPMPESVTDRPTKSHEYLFLLSKSPRYYFDADAVREGFDTPLHAPGNGHPETWEQRRGASVGKGMSGHLAEPDRTWGHPAGRNIRSVWTVATAPYPGAHFATFPPKLIEPCIKAGCPEQVCADCGSPVLYAHGNSTAGLPGVRPVLPDPEAASRGGILFADLLEPSDGTDALDDDGTHQNGQGLHRPVPTGSPDGVQDGVRLRASVSDGGSPWADAPGDRGRGPHQHGQGRQPSGEPAGDDQEGARRPVQSRTDSDGYVSPLRDPLPTPWTCRQCGSHSTAAGVVLDCFAGSGTTGMVAQSLSRRAVLIDLSMDYLDQLLKRNRDIPLGLGA